MLKSLMALIVAAAVAGQAQNPDKPVALRLVSGSQVTFAADRAGDIRLTGQMAESLSPGELDMAQRTIRDHPEAFGPKSAPMQTEKWLQPIKADAIRLRFLPFQNGEHALLMTENGTNQSYMFKARIGRGNRSVVTDDCQLIPATRNLEHWPYPLDWIEISDIHVVPYDKNAPPHCA